MGMNKQNGTLILDQIQVNQKIKRMAYEIYENNFKEKRLFLAGIEGGGYMINIINTPGRPREPIILPLI